jgi:two-component response regulator (ARR-A family)
MSTAMVSEPHILAVDDSLVDRAVISRLLRSSKYRGTASSHSVKQLIYLRRSEN